MTVKKLIVPQPSLMLLWLNQHVQKFAGNPKKLLLILLNIKS